VNPRAEIDPTGVDAACQRVLLGVGVTVVTLSAVLVPPNVATKLATKRPTSAGATYTCDASYCESHAHAAGRRRHIRASGRLEGKERAERGAEER
jgi:hypothetical protein